MMLQRFQKLITLSALLPVATVSFSTRMPNHAMASRTSTSILNVGAVFDEGDRNAIPIRFDDIKPEKQEIIERVKPNESSFHKMFYLKSRATALASYEDDDLPLDEAKNCLKSLEAQKELLTEYLSTEKLNLLDEAIAGLRQKIETIEQDKDALAPAKKALEIVGALGAVYGASVVLTLKTYIAHNLLAAEDSSSSTRLTAPMGVAGGVLAAVFVASVFSHDASAIDSIAATVPTTDTSMLESFDAYSLLSDL